MKNPYCRALAPFLLAALLLLQSFASAADSVITRDPFARPELKKRKPAAVAVKPDKSPKERIMEEAADLELKATIRTGGWAMANINGAMVEQGEKIAGFTLLRIGEEEAVLGKDGIEVILAMKSGKHL